MAEDKIFPDGFIMKPPRETAPEWVLGSISVKVDEFKQWLDDNEKRGWVNLNMKRSQAGKMYCELDTWEPQKQDTQPASTPEGESADDAPF
jgi:hypothetical protein